MCLLSKVLPVQYYLLFLLLSLVNAQKETAFTQKETAFILPIWLCEKKEQENDKRTSCILSNIVSTRAGSTVGPVSSGQHKINRPQHTT